MVPRVLHRLFEAQRNPLGFGIILENFDVYLVADVKHLGRVVYPAPGHIGDMQQTVDATEVDEGAILGDVLDGARNGHSLLEGLKGLGLELVSFLFK